MALLLLPVLTSCGTLKGLGANVCTAELEMSKAIDDALAPFGMPGEVFGGIVGALLKLGCKAFDTILSAPQDLTEATVGLFNTKAPEPEEAPQR